MINQVNLGSGGGMEGSGLETMAASPDLSSASVENLPDGGAEVTFGQESAPEESEQAYDHYANLADILEDSDLLALATDVIEGFEADVTSRQDWENTLARGIDLLGLRIDDTAALFQGACNAVHPLVIENCVKFQAKAIAEIFPAGGPVKTQVLGVQSEEVIAAANRVREYMNFQLTEEIPEFVDEQERMLFYLAFAGIAFKKDYYNAVEERAASEFVKATDFIISNYASDLKSAERYTHRMYKSEVDIAALVRAGVYREVDLGAPVSPKLSDFEVKMNKKLGINQSDNPDRTPGWTLLEQHCYADFEGEQAPYVITVEYNTRKILAVRRNWKEEDDKKRKRIWFVKYSFIPSDGFYSFGFVHLIGGLAKTATLIMRSLVDSGQFSNLQGGFKLKGIKVVKDNGPVAPGEFRDVEVPGAQKLADVIIPFTYKEPSKALYELLQFIVAAGQKFADTTDMVVSDSSSYGPVGTILALLDASSKFFSSIHKRLHKSLRDELRLLRDINSETLPEVYPYDVVGAPREVKAADFAAKMTILPVSDPNIATQAQRTALAQAVVTMSQQAPQIHDVREAYKRVYQNMGIQDVDKILPPPPSAQPQDPLTDLISVSQGKPIASFPGQDHQAHIAVKSAWLQDPMNGMSPMMVQVSPLVQANVREHMIQMYSEQLSGLMKQAAPGQNLPPEIMGKIMADAAQQIQQANQSAGVAEPDKAIADAAQTEALTGVGKLVWQRQKDILDAAQAAEKNEIARRTLLLKEAEAKRKEDVQIVENTKDRKSEMANTALKGLIELSKPKPVKKGK